MNTNIFNQYTLDYILSVKRNSKKEDIFSLSRNLHHILINVDFSKTEIVDIWNHFFIQMEQDLSFFRVKDAIKSYSRQDERCISLLDYVINNEIENKDDLIISILLGLYEYNKDLVYQRIISLLQEPNDSHLGLHTLALMNYTSKVQFDYTFSLITNFKSVNNNSVLSVTLFLIKNLNNKYILDYQTEKAWELINHYSNSDSQVQNYILNILYNVKGYEDKKLEILLSMDFRKIETYHSLNFLLDDFKNVDYFFAVLKKAMIDLKDDFTPKLFHSISTFQRSEPKAFSKGLIQLLIDELGVIRFLANKVLSYLQSHNKFNFSTDLLQYSEREQEWLIASLSGMFTYPKDTLHLLLPLRNSKYSYIKDLLKAKIEVLINDYSDSIISIMENELDLNNTNDGFYLEEFKAIEQENQNSFLKKIKVKEIISSHSHARLYNLFNSKNDNKMAKEMEEGKKQHEENSFLKYFPTVVLARGNSYKFAENGRDKFVPLGKISASMTFPRSMFLNNDKYEYDANNEINQNWKVDE
ncbi:hypothetical protein [Bernardetia sp. MNP-M8]|uniref:hypothetical protein n=1 Tax=Bernardetia sp. MNP-M8 TaxID=3127470 RepID=UPI0030D5AB4C